ncbi:hypothetical protein SSCG_01129 [Streptomyces clavuligerus]|nr:hypothetical protein SSCG_01129 [Streptomyces clavuligerus]
MKRFQVALSSQDEKKKKKKKKKKEPCRSLSAPRRPLGTRPARGVRNQGVRPDVDV